MDGAGLTLLPDDKRDFSHTAVFGTLRAQELPTGDFRVGPPPDIKDQDSEDFCAFYSSGEASEYQELTPLEQYFNAYVAKVIVLKNPESWGCDLRTAMMTHVNYGAIELEFSPFKEYETRPTRAEVLSPNTWDSPQCPFDQYKMLAWEHRKNSMFNVDEGPHDRFDNFRVALYMHRNEYNAIVTGAQWRPSWTDAPGGIIPATGWEDETSTGHAFILVGQKYIDNVVYIVAQLSNGKKIGDNGFFYFPRSVILSEFNYGAFMFNDMPREKAQTHLYYGTSVNESFLVRFYKIMSRIVADFFTAKKSL